MKIKLFFSKFSWPVLILAAMLQRSPVIRLIAEIEFSLMPRVQHLWSALAAAVTVGAYNTVTGATGDLRFRSGEGNTSVAVGEELRIIVEVEGGLTPETWIVPSNAQLPDGVTASFNINFGIATISGIPTEAGSFPVTIQAWERSDMQGDQAPDFDFIITVEAVGPVFTQQPANQEVAWGSPLNLSAAVDSPEGTSYQWQRLLPGEADYSDIEGQTSATLDLASLTKADEGMYRVVATDVNGSLESDAALISVSATPYQLWKESNFPDPFAANTALDLDPDLDSLINAMEFTFGLNPHVPESQALIQTSQERIADTLYAVFAFPPIPTGVDSSIVVESNSRPDSTGWVELLNGVNGAIIENLPEGFFVKIPSSQVGFKRLRIDAN